MGIGVGITGTDTGCGKTWFSWLLVKALREAGYNAVGWKPFCCGEREDAYTLHSASEEVLALDEVNPVWLRTPIAPYPASELEGTSFILDEVLAAGERLREKYEVVVCEGVGGWEVPLDAANNYSDFAMRLGWKQNLVVGNRLGALNHTLLTARAIQSQECELAGVILNQVNEEQEVAHVTNRGVLEQRLPGLVFGEVMHGASQLEPDLFEVFWQKNSQ